MPSLFHQYPKICSTYENQLEYEREVDAATKTQVVHFAVPPRGHYVSPLGVVSGPGSELTINDFVGGEESPFNLLREAVLSGRVIMPQHLSLTDRQIQRQPTLVVNNDDIVVEPQGGWQPHPASSWSKGVQDDWVDQCRAAEATARAPYVVAPLTVLRLHKGSLKALEPVGPANFRYTAHKGLPQHQLERLVDLGLVLRALRPEGFATPLDAG